MLDLYVTAPKGTSHLLAAELLPLGAVELSPGPAGVAAKGSLETAYRICLWSRVASRVLVTLGHFPAPDAAALYDGVRAFDWTPFVPDGATLAVSFSGMNEELTNTHFGALKVKDAIVDQLRELRGTRPSIDTVEPDVRIHVRLYRDEATVRFDLSGESLHRRGYRERGGEAPLKENLAAALLIRGGWPDIAHAGGAFVDPMCGSGTLPIEAALIAGDVAPGLLRSRWGFERWPDHDAALWQRIRSEAEARRDAGIEKLPPLHGSDRDTRAIANARDNAWRAGLGDRITWSATEVAAAEPPAGATPGLVLTNPPYGERMGDPGELEPLYRALGDRLLAAFGGWTAGVFTVEPQLARALGLRVRGKHVFFNGALRCTLYRLAVDRPVRKEHVFGPGAEALKNRLVKDHEKFSRWAKRASVTCYRVYDGDLPEYAFAVDRYERWLHVQEYAAPRHIDPELARARRRDLLALLPETLGVERDDVFVKVRQRQKGHSQYDKQDERGALEEVHEGGHTFLVNFTDYIDTGLFLDHRPTRALLGELAKGRRFLNLFSYTATATVYAACAGAPDSVSVDLSQTYGDWAAKNFHANDVDERRHQIVRDDVLQWLEEKHDPFGLIFLDPPTFSTSKSMEDTLDVQRDHIPLLRRTSELLAPDGVLIFSTNFRRFRLDVDGLPELAIEDITARTIPEDFARSPRIHSTYRITRRA